MELRHLRYFVAVAEALSFRRAAERLHLAQPSLGRQVRDLEDEVGCRLFERDRQHVALTDAGYVLLDEARQILARADTALEAAREAGRGIRGSLRIGNVAALSSSFLPATLAAFRKMYPGVEIELLETNPEDQRTDLLTDTIHLGFQSKRGLTPDARFAMQTVVTCDVIVALPLHHPLTRRRSIELSTLAGEMFVNYRPRQRSSYETWLRALCEEVGGFTPRLCRRAIDNPSAFFGMVAAGEGLAIVPKIGVHDVDTHGGWVTRPLRSPKPGYELVAIWKEGNPSLVLKNYLALLAKRGTRRRVK